MAAVAQSDRGVDLDAVTLGVKPNEKALALKSLALAELSSEEEEEEEEEEEKKEEEKIDTDDENLMFSDEDCAPLTESEDSEDSVDEGMIELGRQMYEQMQATAGASGLTQEAITLPPVEVPRRAL